MTSSAEFNMLTTLQLPERERESRHYDQPYLSYTPSWSTVSYLCYAVQTILMDRTAQHVAERTFGLDINVIPLVLTGALALLLGLYVTLVTKY